MPRSLLAVAVIVGATLLGSGGSRAGYDDGRWCAMFNNGNGAVKEICHFQNFEACRLEVVSGNRGVCGYNPRYVAKADPGPRRHRRY
jgi:hypothetical protein